MVGFGVEEGKGNPTNREQKDEKKKKKKRERNTKKQTVEKATKFKYHENTQTNKILKKRQCLSQGEKNDKSRLMQASHFFVVFFCFRL